MTKHINIDEMLETIKLALKHKTEEQKRQAVLELINDAKVNEWETVLQAEITHSASPALFNPEGLPISTPATEEMTRLLHQYAESRLTQLRTTK